MTYRTRKVGDSYFVTTDHGTWALLDESELKQLKNGKYSGDLQRELEIKEIILNENNLLDSITELKKHYSFLGKGTALHIVIPTLRCNMKCVYCHASSRAESEEGFDMDINTAEKTVKFIMQADPKTIEFQGGEPLLNWKVVKHMIELAKDRVGFTLVTNMELMNNEKMDYLIKNNVSVCTSLDGPKELHDANRKAKSSNYETVVKWIRLFNDEYKKRGMDKKVNALVTLTKKSLSHPEIIDEYAKLGQKEIHLRFLNKIGVAKDAWGSISYTEMEFLDFWKKALKRMERYGMGERMLNIMLQKVYGKDPGYLNLRSPCGAVIGQLTYNYDGKIYSCDEGRMTGDDMFLVGTVDGTYGDIMKSDNACAIVSSSINDQYICDSCAYKPYCGVCPVCNYAETGSITSTMTTRCRIFKQQFDWIVENKLKKMSRS